MNVADAQLYPQHTHGAAMGDDEDGRGAVDRLQRIPCSVLEFRQALTIWGGLRTVADLFQRLKFERAPVPLSQTVQSRDRQAEPAGDGGGGVRGALLWAAVDGPDIEARQGFSRGVGLGATKRGSAASRCCPRSNRRYWLRSRRGGGSRTVVETGVVARGSPCCAETIGLRS